MGRGQNNYKKEAGDYLYKNQELLQLTNEKLQHKLKLKGFYSRKTYYRDINIEALRKHVQRRQNEDAIHSRVQAGDEIGGAGGGGGE